MSSYEGSGSATSSDELSASSATTLVRDYAASLFACAAGAVDVQTVSGGDINECFYVKSSDGDEIFIKANSAPELLISEHQSLQNLANLGIDSYPAIIGFKELSGFALMALKHYHLAPLNEQTGGIAARTLLTQHDTEAQQFGWPLDGFIGASPQFNSWSDSWLEFYTQRRLAPQLAMASGNGLNAATVLVIEKVISNLDSYIDTANITPSLLHGDLWGGNLGFDLLRQCPVLYDPAPYYGDPEADIAMTRLFGTLPNSFYTEYRKARPEPQDIRQREPLYNLYHALNHFNLFGPQYEPMIMKCCRQFL